MSDVQIYTLEIEDYDAVIELGNEVHGDNYLFPEKIQEIRERSIKDGINCSLVAYNGPREAGKLLGFRLTYAPGMWEPDRWCSIERWGYEPDELCYFKCNTVSEESRGTGIGSRLLHESIECAKKQGAEAGITHIWMQSPGNSAFKYFKKNGGQVVEIHENRWADDYKNENYICIVDGEDCICSAAEMILRFKE